MVEQRNTVSVMLRGRTWLRADEVKVRRRSFIGMSIAELIAISTPARA